MHDEADIEPGEWDEYAAVSHLYAVEGYGMVRVESVPGDRDLPWLPYEPARRPGHAM